METARKRLLVILQRPPYGNAATREALDAALAAAAFDVTVQILFTGDGVWQLLPDQKTGKQDTQTLPQGITGKHIGNMLGALAYYDIHGVFVDSAALEERGLSQENLLLPAVPAPADTLRALLRDADHVIAL